MRHGNGNGTRKSQYLTGREAKSRSAPLKKEAKKKQQERNTWDLRGTSRTKRRIMKSRMKRWEEEEDGLDTELEGNGGDD